MTTPDALNSKIAKIRIELPHYSFSHSSSGESSHHFLGRERIREKIKKVIEDSPDEPGVYLIAGNRGVGKTSLVNWVINETSLEIESNLFKNLRYILFLLLAVAGIYVANQICLNKFWIPGTNLAIFWILIFFLSFILLCCSNDYRRKFFKKNIVLTIWDSIESALKEFSYLINPRYPDGKTQSLLRIIAVVSYTQIIPLLNSDTVPVKAFVFYLCFICAFMFWRYVRDKLHEYYVKYKKDEISKKSVYDIENKFYIRAVYTLFKLASLVILFLPLCTNFIGNFNIFRFFVMLIPFFMVFLFISFWCGYLEKDMRLKCIVQILIHDPVLNPIKNYIKNRNRLYLRINFGHKLKDEKDILRLIVRTLSAEYTRYRRSFRRMLPLRVIVFGLLFLFAYLFSNMVEKQKFYVPIKNSPLYKASSQIFLKEIVYSVKTNNERLDEHMENVFPYYSKFNNVEYYLLALDDVALEISKRAVNIPKYFWEGKDKVNIDNTEKVKFIFPIDYLFWLSFFLMYLSCKIIFHCNWITHFFVTHQIIKRRLKKLNSDIIHSTERETSTGFISIDSERIGPGIGVRAKKSRSIADAREIEKELQDILNSMQQIPDNMSRPNIVVVFDELDKIEPDAANSEKENTQTKASLFSIEATRERQTEILRILSNMKYFLSTARAKFVFIAGREMFDIHLADVSERNNYIGSIFNVVILVPSFLTDHHTGKKLLPQESSIASLPEEFVCRKLIPTDYPVESYDLKNYKLYLEDVIYKTLKDKKQKKEIVQKITAVLQQFIIYLAHVSKGAPKKMMQLFESFIDIHIKKDENENTLFVQRYHGSRYFLSFNYYKQYTLGIIAYFITPVFYRLAESNIKEQSDKLLVSSLRFVDFLFKFHKHSFSWKILDISPEMLEVNRAPELKSVAVDLLNYLAQVHMNKSNFSLSEYKFDSLIANEIFAMAKTDEVFSALFSFSLDEMLPLKKHYQDLLEKKEKEYQKKKRISVFIDAIASLQGLLGDLHYYDDELEEAEAYYKSSVQALLNLGQKRGDKAEKEDEKMTLDQLYVYVRNMLRLGMIYEKRKQYEFAYLAYGELCKRIIRERYIVFNKLGIGVELREDNDKNIVFIKASDDHLFYREKEYHDNIKIHELEKVEPVGTKLASLQPLNFETITPKTNDILFKKMTFEGLKMLYLPFIAKLQILELSHIGGITRNHLEQLDKEFELLTFIIDHKEAKLLEAEFFSRAADIIYYKNSDLKCKKNKNRKKEDDDKSDKTNDDIEILGASQILKDDLPANCSCTVCYYYHKALSILLNKPYFDKSKKKSTNTVIKLLITSIRRLKESQNMKFYTILARILSDWGNVFFSCDSKNKKDGCYICDAADCNTQNECDLPCTCRICDIDDCEGNNSLGAILEKYMNSMDSKSKKENRKALIKLSKNNFTKMKIAFAMYTISSEAYRKASLYKRASYQIYKMLCLFKHYKIYFCRKSEDCIKQLSKKAIHYLWYANEDLNVLELNKRKKDFDKKTIKDKIPLQYLLVDGEITRISILVKDLKLKLNQTPENLKKYYDMRITSPYKVNYSLGDRIYRLWFKSKLNYKAYLKLIEKSGTADDLKKEIEFILEKNDCNDTAKTIFGDYFNFDNERKAKIRILENLIAETIYCLVDIAQLSETMGETFVCTNNFLGSIHKKLSFWIRLYETYELYKEENRDIAEVSKIEGYFKKYLDEEWREQLSGHRENKRALSYYYKCLEMHNEGRAYHNMIDTMIYLRDDYNDRSDHFNIAEERHLIANGKIENEINNIKDLYKDSGLYKADNYLGQGDAGGPR